ncbi:MAG: hypothetical protein WD055_02485 [Candidatus Dependentiae bacterium]
MRKQLIVSLLCMHFGLMSITPWYMQQGQQQLTKRSVETKKERKLKYLHIGFHKGCILEVDRVAKDLDIDVTPWFIFDKPLEHFEGQNAGLYVYNITAERAQRVWEKHKDYFDQFDAIITSDTAPLSRIFLQNDNWKKPLIIWVCNRFDFFFSPSHKPLDFPDETYYELFRTATKKNNVFVVSYTPYEWYHALQKGVDIGLRTIKPIGVVEGTNRYRDPKWSVPAHVDKESTVFLYPRLNEQQMHYINEQCTKNNIKTYSGRYNGTNDIADFKGIMYWPYQWSNLCLFEDFHRGLVHFVPSISFLKQLEDEGAPIHPVMSSMLENRTFEFNEWYCKDHKELIVYYDSWQDLQHKIENTDYFSMRKKIKAFASEHKKDMMHRWKELFDDVLLCAQKEA